MSAQDYAIVGRTAGRLGRVVELSLCEAELSSAQYRLLAFLAERTLAASALATGLGVSRPSITAVVDGLVERHLVARTEDPDDRRRVAHTLTPAGLEVLRIADEAVDRALRSVASALEPHDAETALNSLELWREALDTHYERRRTAAQ